MAVETTPPMESASHAPSAQRSARAGLEQTLGAIVMALLVLITLTNVVVRYLTSQSFAWTEEISVFLLVVMTLAGSAWAAARDAHIRIEFFYLRDAKPRRWLALLSALATALMFAMLAVLLARAAVFEYQFGETTTGLGVPRWWYTAWLPVLAAWIAIRAAGRGLQLRHERRLRARTEERT